LCTDVNEDIRVLVVDDSEFFGTLVAGELAERYGMATERTTGAEEALAVLAAERVDCVVSDYDMPAMDGIELFREIRDRGHDVPFFLLTAAGSEAVASEAVTAGIDDYFPKSEGGEQFEILGRRISNVVEQRRAENRLSRQRRLHGTLWRITQELMTLTSRPAIAERVCEGLAEDDPFEFAWLSDEGGDPISAAGIEPHRRGPLREAARDDGPIDTAHEENRVSAARFDATGGEGVTLTAIPLSHQDDCFGVLAVGSASPLSESAREALSHLGTTVGHALASVEMEREVEIFREAVEQADTAICITDTGGHIEYANSAFGAITGHDPDGVVGDPLEMLSTGTWDEEFYESVWRRVRGGESVRREVVQQAADGSQFYADLSVAPLRPDGGAVEKFVLIESDITALKSNQQRLEVLNRVLRHNLRNDLNVIQGNLSLVLESLSGDPERSRLEDAQRKVDSLLSLAEKAQFANNAVGAVGDGDSQTEVDLAELLTTELETIADRYPGASLESDTPPPVSTRGVQLHAAIRELLDNAVRHNDGDPAVRIRTDLESAPEGMIHVDVIDNGPGLPDNERETLARGRETDLMHGSSLGLWLVHWIVTHVGGQLSIERTGDAGTTVRLSLPVAGVSTRSPA
jgi:PAS domain S-box-containing protein